MHPSDGTQCWCGEDSISFDEDGNMILDINYNPAYFEEIKDNRLYSVGYVSSIDSYRYGTFEFEYKLPIGKNLWPALWITAVGSWPPEIDFMEGWSSKGYFIKGLRNYRRIPLFNNIVPGVVGSDDKGNVIGKGIKATFFWFQRTGRWIKCKGVWTPDYVDVYYDGHRVFHMTDKKFLEQFNKPDVRMKVDINTYTTENFTKEDYYDYKVNGEPFYIKNFKYTPYVE